MQPLIPFFEQPVIPITDTIGLYGFGILVAIGFIIGTRVAVSRAERLGLDSGLINRLVGWLVLGTFVGGRWGFELMYEPGKGVFEDPGRYLTVFGGLSSFGGIITCIVIAVVFFAREKVRVWPYLDCLAHGFAIGWFFGRMGCFVAHDHPGAPTEFLLGQYGIGHPEAYPGQYGPDATVAFHNLGLYEALWSLGVFGLFRLMDGVPRVAGFYPLLLGVLYGPVRFGMDFLRPEVTDPRYGFLALTPGQYGSILFFLVCIGFFVWILRKGEVVQPEAAVEAADGDAAEDPPTSRVEG